MVGKTMLAQRVSSTSIGDITPVLFTARTRAHLAELATCEHLFEIRSRNQFSAAAAPGQICQKKFGRLRQGRKPACRELLDRHVDAGDTPVSG
jgi:hypothetical protein